MDETSKVRDIEDDDEMDDIDEEDLNSFLNIDHELNNTNVIDVQTINVVKHLEECEMKDESVSEEDEEEELAENKLLSELSLELDEPIAQTAIINDDIDDEDNSSKYVPTYGGFQENCGIEQNEKGKDQKKNLETNKDDDKVKEKIANQKEDLVVKQNEDNQVDEVEDQVDDQVDDEVEGQVDDAVGDQLDGEVDNKIDEVEVGIDDQEEDIEYNQEYDQEEVLELNPDEIALKYQLNDKEEHGIEGQVEDRLYDEEDDHRVYQEKVQVHSQVEGQTENQVDQEEDGEEDGISYVGEEEMKEGQHKDHEIDQGSVEDKNKLNVMKGNKEEQDMCVEYAVESVKEEETDEKKANVNEISIESVLSQYAHLNMIKIRKVKGSNTKSIKDSQNETDAHESLTNVDKTKSHSEVQLNDKDCEVRSILAKYGRLNALKVERITKGDVKTKETHDIKFSENESVGNKNGNILRVHKINEKVNDFREDEKSDRIKDQEKDPNEFLEINQVADQEEDKKIVQDEDQEMVQEQDQEQDQEQNQGQDQENDQEGDQEVVQEEDQEEDQLVESTHENNAEENVSIDVADAELEQNEINSTNESTEEQNSYELWEEENGLNLDEDYETQEETTEESIEDGVIVDPHKHSNDLLNHTETEIETEVQGEVEDQSDADGQSTNSDRNYQEVSIPLQEIYKDHAINEIKLKTTDENEEGSFVQYEEPSDVKAESKDADLSMEELSGFQHPQMLVDNAIQKEHATGKVVTQKEYFDNVLHDDPAIANIEDEVENSTHFQPINLLLPSYIKQENYLESPILPTLPPDWGFSPSGLLLPPASIQFHFSSRVPAYQALLSSSASQTQIEQLFDSFASDGWKASELLPPGWIWQEVAYDEANFFNKEGIFIVSFEKTLDYIKSCGRYTEEDVENFKLLQSNNRKETVDSGWLTKMEMLQESNQYSEANQPSGWLTQFGGLDEEQENIPDLPPGWKIKGRGLTGPKGGQYSTVKHALLALKIQGAEESTIEAIMSLDLAKGWTNQKLPPGWLAKGATVGYTFISPKGLCFTGKERAASHLEGLGGSQEDKKLIEHFSSDQAKRVWRKKVKQEKVSFNEFDFEPTENYTRVTELNEKETLVDPIHMQKLEETPYKIENVAFVVDAVKPFEKIEEQMEEVKADNKFEEKIYKNCEFQEGREKISSAEDVLEHLKTLQDLEIIRVPNRDTKKSTSGLIKEKESIDNSEIVQKCLNDTNDTEPLETNTEIKLETKSTSEELKASDKLEENHIIGVDPRDEELRHELMENNAEQIEETKEKYINSFMDAMLLPINRPFAQKEESIVSCQIKRKSDEKSEGTNKKACPDQKAQITDHPVPDEGWQPSEYLPADWMSKPSGGRNVMLRNSEDRRFSNKRQAVERKEGCGGEGLQKLSKSPGGLGRKRSRPGRRAAVTTFTQGTGEGDVSKCEGTDIRKADSWKPEVCISPDLAETNNEEVETKTVSDEVETAGQHHEDIKTVSDHAETAGRQHGEIQTVSDEVEIAGRHQGETKTVSDNVETGDRHQGETKTASDDVETAGRHQGDINAVSDDVETAGTHQGDINAISDDLETSGRHQKDINAVSDDVETAGRHQGEIKTVSDDVETTRRQHVETKTVLDDTEAEAESRPDVLSLNGNVIPIGVVVTNVSKITLEIMSSKEFDNGKSKGLENKRDNAKDNRSKVMTSKEIVNELVGNLKEERRKQRKPRQPKTVRKSNSHIKPETAIGNISTIKTLTNTAGKRSLETKEAETEGHPKKIFLQFSDIGEILAKLKRSG